MKSDSERIRDPASTLVGSAASEAVRPITDAMRWQYMIEHDHNVIGFMHLLRLLLDKKGDKAAFVKMTDRVIRSAQAAGHTKIDSDDLLEALRLIEGRLSDFQEDTGTPDSDTAREIARQAIMKAEGR